MSPLLKRSAATIQDCEQFGVLRRQCVECIATVESQNTPSSRNHLDGFNVRLNISELCGIESHLSLALGQDCPSIVADLITGALLSFCSREDSSEDQNAKGSPKEKLAVIMKLEADGEIELS